MGNFIPNKVIKIIPRDPPWIDNHLKTMLKQQQRLYRNYKRHGFKVEDKVRVDKFRDECNLAIQNAKQVYLNKLGNKLSDPKSCQKAYWKIINRVMNRCKAPKIPPLLVNNIFKVNAKDKAQEFITYFSKQCKPLLNSSTLPNLSYLTNQRLNDITFTNVDIISVIRSRQK